MKPEIANRLYEYRKAAGMSQEKVASTLGVSRQAVSKWECAESSPDTDNLIALAQLYGVSVDELLFSDPKADLQAALPKAEAPEELPAGQEQGNEEQESDAEDDFVDEDPRRYSGEDYTDISFQRGVHVRDSRKGEEVHVDWNGIHIDSAEGEHIHINFSDFESLGAAIRQLRKSKK